MYYKIHYPSILGDLLLVSDEENIVGLWMGDHKYIDEAIPSEIMEKNDLPVLKAGRAWLDNYFAGKNPAISDLPLLPVKGTDFRQVVWKLLREISYGEVVTYGELSKKVAKRMGKERMSAQAVGGAVGHNPFSIIVPCHRVVGANGNLTGYGGGITNKIKLLTHEGVDMQKFYVPQTNPTL